MTDGEGTREPGTTLTATILSLLAAALLFVILNFILGSIWSSVLGGGQSRSGGGYWTAEIVRAVLFFGLLPWLALELSRRVITKGKISTIVAVCIALVAVSVLIRVWALVKILGTLGPGDGQVREFALLSVALVLFQGVCSLVAIWLFRTRHKDSMTENSER